MVAVVMTELAVLDGDGFDKRRNTVGGDLGVMENALNRHACPLCIGSEAKGRDASLPYPSTLRVSRGRNRHHVFRIFRLRRAMHHGVGPVRATLP